MPIDLTTIPALEAQAILLELLDYDPNTGELRWKPRVVKWFTRTQFQSSWNARWASTVARNTTSYGGFHVVVLKRGYKVHRLIWLMVHGVWPDTIDHINGDPADNRLDNLRSVTKAINSQNMKRFTNNTSGVTGVSFDTARGTWAAYVNHLGVRTTLGRFTALADAVAVRKQAEVQYGFHSNHGR
jgi:HNH endonuclease